MKKYNRSEIMKKAWEINRKLKNTFTEALKMSWILAKKAVGIKEEHCRPEGKVTFKIWANYGKVRAYYTCSWRSNYANSKSYNYVNL